MNRTEAETEGMWVICKDHTYSFHNGTVWWYYAKSDEKPKLDFPTSYQKNKNILTWRSFGGYKQELHLNTLVKYSDFNGLIQEWECKIWNRTKNKLI
jgi:hypothetical protein